MVAATLVTNRTRPKLARKSRNIAVAVDLLTPALAIDLFDYCSFEVVSVENGEDDEWNAR